VANSVVPSRSLLALSAAYSYGDSSTARASRATSARSAPRAGRRGCGGSCCGGCGGSCAAKCCGGCGGSCAAKPDPIGPYTPTYRLTTAKLPAKPVLGAARRLDKQLEGVMGFAVNGVSFVGEHVSPTSGHAGALTMTFDNCGGHGDSDHKYHYHIPPVCLLRSLNATVPATPDWWLSPHPEGTWPAKGSSPLLGWALDGFPIFGPYDPETGDLQMPTGTGCTSTLDECNGKLLSNHQYAYFVTPVYPFVPKCLKGTEVKVPTDEPHPAGTKACPALGYAPLVSFSSTDCYKTYQFLFDEVWKYSQVKPRWEVASTILGSLYLIASIFVLFLIKPKKVLLKVKKHIRKGSMAAVQPRSPLRALGASPLRALASPKRNAAPMSQRSPVGAVRQPKPDKPSNFELPANATAPGNESPSCKSLLPVASVPKAEGPEDASNPENVNLVCPQDAQQTSAILQPQNEAQHNMDQIVVVDYDGTAQEPKEPANTPAAARAPLQKSASQKVLSAMKKAPSMVKAKSATNLKVRETEIDLIGLHSSLQRMYWGVVTILISRAFFLLVDPYYMRRIVPRFILGIAFGVVYPAVNLCACELLYLLGLSVKHHKFYVFALQCTFAQLVTQLMMDYLRSTAEQPDWHYVCQIFYICWGAVVILVGVMISAEQHAFVSLLDTALSGVQVVFSVILLAFSVGTPATWSNFIINQVLRIIELAVAMVYTFLIQGVITVHQDHSPPAARLPSSSNPNGDDELANNPSPSHRNLKPTDRAPGQSLFMAVSPRTLQPTRNLTYRIFWPQEANHRTGTHAALAAPNPKRPALHSRRE